jgi:hypothetical protein
MKFNGAMFDLEVTPDLSECTERWSFCVLQNTIVDKDGEKKNSTEDL